MSLTLKAELLFSGVAALVFLGMVLFQLLGRSYAAHRPARPEGTTGQGAALIEGAVFALLGLLLAFSFSGAETRLQVRRDLILREVDAIEAVYLRLDVLPEADRPALEDAIRRYTDTRIAIYRHPADFHATHPDRLRSEQLQRQIWKGALRSAARASDARATIVLSPALSELIDTARARDAALLVHIPLAVFVMLGLLAGASGFLAGMNMARPERLSPLHVFILAGTMSVTAYVILNIEFPRLGFVHLDVLDTFLVRLRATMT